MKINLFVTFDTDTGLFDFAMTAGTGADRQHLSGERQRHGEDMYKRVMRSYVEHCDRKRTHWDERPAEGWLDETWLYINGTLTERRSHRYFTEARLYDMLEQDMAEAREANPNAEIVARYTRKPGIVV